MPYEPRCSLVRGSPLAGGGLLDVSGVNLEATSAVTFGGVLFLLSAAALVASWLPARRASRVDPMVALRND